MKGTKFARRLRTQPAHRGRVEASRRLNLQNQIDSKNASIIGIATQSIAIASFSLALSLLSSLAFSLFDLYTNYFESTVDNQHPGAAWAFNGTLVVVLAVFVRQEHRRLTEELSQSTHVLMIEHRFGRKLERLAHRHEHVQVQESTPLV